MGTSHAEQVASGILKEKMRKENIPDGGKFSLATGGKPLNVQVGTPENKTDRKPVQQISFSVIKELQILMELSDRQTIQMISGLRKGLGSRASIEPGTFGKLKELEDSISKFYFEETVIKLNK